MANENAGCPGEARCLRAVGDRLTALAQMIRKHPADAIRSPQRARIAQRLDTSAQNLRMSAESIERLEELVKVMLREGASGAPENSVHAPTI